MLDITISTCPRYSTLFFIRTQAPNKHLRYNLEYGENAPKHSEVEAKKYKLTSLMLPMGLHEKLTNWEPTISTEGFQIFRAHDHYHSNRKWLSTLTRTPARRRHNPILARRRSGSPGHGFIISCVCCVGTSFSLNTHVYDHTERL